LLLPREYDLKAFVRTDWRYENAGAVSLYKATAEHLPFTFKKKKNAGAV
jgi:hypothetical protein